MGKIQKILFLSIVPLSIALFFSSHVKAYTMDGDGTVLQPYVITNCEQLQEILDNSTDNFVLGNNVDCSATATWNDAGGGNFMGFNPIHNFSGGIDGQDFTISHLFINRPSTVNVGLFSSVIAGTVQNLNLTDANIHGSNSVGIIAGHLEGASTINNVNVQGTLLGTYAVGGIAGEVVVENDDSMTISSVRTNVVIEPTLDEAGYGGIVGFNNMNTGGDLLIETSSANLTLNGLDAGITGVGGIIGYSTFADDSLLRIFNNHTLGVISGDSSVGGLIGQVQTTFLSVGDRGNLLLNYNYSIADVSAKYGNAGGLIGRVNSTEMSMSIYSNIFAGSLVVSNDDNVGGFIGQFYDNTTGFTPSIVDSYVDADIAAYGNNVGGMVGTADTPLNIQDSYVTGSLINSVDRYTGGLVGNYNGGLISNSFSTTKISIRFNVAPSANYQAAVVANLNSGNVSNVYFDQTITGQDICIAPIEDTENCLAVNTDGNDPNYFKTAPPSQPISGWNFEGTWTAFDLFYPTFQVNPTDFLDATINQHSIVVNWTPMEDAVGYQLQFRKHGDIDWTKVTLSNITSTSASIAGLDAFTSYEVRVRVLYQKNISRWNETAYVTLPEDPAPEPTPEPSPTPNPTPGTQNTTRTGGSSSSNNSSSNTPVSSPTSTAKPTTTTTPVGETVTIGTKIILNVYPEFGQDGKLMNLKPGQVIYFITKDNDEHSATIQTVTEDTVTFILRSTPMTVTMKVGEIQQFDVTGDGINDVEVNVKGTKDGIADMTFKQLDQPANYWWICCVLIIVALVIAYIVRRKLKNKEEKKNK